MDREKAIRHKVFELLNAANIQYDDGDISIWDEKAEDTTNNNYILLRDQTAQGLGDFCMNKWTCSFEMGVVTKSKDGVSKDVADDIGEQLENALYNNLVNGIEYQGWQYNNFTLDSANYSTFVLSPTESEIEKTFVFRFTATKL